MKTIAIAVLLLLPAFASGKDNPKPAEYNVNIHVSASRIAIENGSSVYVQRLSVVIDEKSSN